MNRAIRSTRPAGAFALACGFILTLGCGSADMATAEAPAEAPPATRIDIRNARMPLPGVLTGGQPTEEQIEQAAQAGYRTIVNLRAAGEEGFWDEAPKAGELGLRFVAIPISSAEDLSAENARKLAEILDDPGSRPVMVHCGSGNRVGALFAMKAALIDGEDAETALRIGREAGMTRLEEAVAQRLR